MNRILASAALIGAMAAASPALATTVRDCDGVTDAAYNIVEPWESNSRTFYQGKVRVAWLDTGGEPACCSSHLLVMFYVESDDEPPGLVCRVVSADGKSGFAGIDFKSLKSSYDPKKGLLLSFGYSVFPPGGYGDRPDRGSASVRINLASGAVGVE